MGPIVRAVRQQIADELLSMDHDGLQRDQYFVEVPLMHHFDNAARVAKWAMAYRMVHYQDSMDAQVMATCLDAHTDCKAYWMGDN